MILQYLVDFAKPNNYTTSCLPFAENLLGIVYVKSRSLFAFLNGTSSSLADAQKEPDRAWKSDGLLLYGVIRLYLRSLFFFFFFLPLTGFTLKLDSLTTEYSHVDTH